MARAVKGVAMLLQPPPRLCSRGRGMGVLSLVAQLPLQLVVAVGAALTTGAAVRQAAEGEGAAAVHLMDSSSSPLSISTRCS
jgi:hypothetical protein